MAGHTRESRDSKRTATWSAVDFQKMAEGRSAPEEELERATGAPEQEPGGERGDEPGEQKSEPTAARSGKKVNM